KFKKHGLKWTNDNDTDNWMENADDWMDNKNSNDKKRVEQILKLGGSMASAGNQVTMEKLEMLLKTQLQSLVYKEQKFRTVLPPLSTLKEAISDDD
ncbi:MAG: hypothetical protein AAF310_05445, partial [Myxococcota bacterium]